MWTDCNFYIHTAPDEPKRNNVPAWQANRPAGKGVQDDLDTVAKALLDLSKQQRKRPDRRQSSRRETGSRGEGPVACVGARARFVSGN